MRVLVACEFTGEVRDAFALRGHFAVSCDFLASERPGYHYRGNVKDILRDGWDLMVAHPPCTFLSSAGGVWMRYRRQQQYEAVKFFMTLWHAPIPMICIENPIGIINSLYMRPDQKIEPWQFGHPYTKRTCLWLKNLPRLRATRIIDPRKYDLASYVRTVKSGHDRSRTFPGVAAAMARQWNTKDLYSREVRPSRAIP